MPKSAKQQALEAAEAAARETKEPFVDSDVPADAAKSCVVCGNVTDEGACTVCGNSMVTGPINKQVTP